MNVVSKSEIDNISLFKLGSNFLGRPRMYVYSFLVDGMLIDTGQPRVEKEFLKILAKEHIDKIILTHHHEDHAGNVTAIKKAKNIDAFASHLCVEKLKNPVRVEPARWITWGQNKKSVVIPFETNQIITKNYQFQIIHTPGHAPDQISLYEANQGWLFSGDLFVHERIKIFMRDENIHDQITSIERCLELDFQALLCNHQPLKKNGKKALRNKLEYLKNFRDEVLALHDKGLKTNAIKKKLNIRVDNSIKILSLGQLSLENMIQSVLKAPGSYST